MTIEFYPYEPKQCRVVKVIRNSRGQEFAWVIVDPPFGSAEEDSLGSKRLANVLLWNQSDKKGFGLEDQAFKFVKVYESLRDGEPKEDFLNHVDLKVIDIGKIFRDKEKALLSNWELSLIHRSPKEKRENKT